MDVLLETNLDDAIASDIGFMTPIDEASLVNVLLFMFCEVFSITSHRHYC